MKYFWINCVTLLPKFILHFDTKIHLGYNGFLNAFRPSTFCTENGDCRTNWNVELKNGPAVKERNTDKFTLFLKNFILRETLVIWYWSIEEQVALSICAEEKNSSSIPIHQGLEVGSDFALTDKYYKWWVWSFLSLIPLFIYLRYRTALLLVDGCSAHIKLK